MKKAKISWFVKESDDIYTGHEDYYAGTCISNEDFIVETEVWNNKWSNEDAEDIKNANLIISFSAVEDSILLQLMDVSIDGGSYEKVNVTALNMGVVKLGSLSGSKNNGTSAYKNNYKRIAVRIKNVPENLRDGLKSMLLDIQF